MRRIFWIRPLDTSERKEFLKTNEARLHQGIYPHKLSHVARVLKINFRFMKKWIGMMATSLHPLKQERQQSSNSTRHNLFFNSIYKRADGSLMTIHNSNIKVKMINTILTINKAIITMNLLLWRKLVLKQSTKAILQVLLFLHSSSNLAILLQKLKIVAKLFWHLEIVDQAPPLYTGRPPLNLRLSIPIDFTPWRKGLTSIS